MTPTELQLLAIHKSPVVRLADICEQYMNSNYQWARQKASLHMLPFPAWRVDESSTKSPWVVRVSDLAAYLDARGRASKAEWDKSQV